jgi:ferredoxin-NADP reductase
MESYTVGIKSIEKITHDVVKVRTKKPLNYAFVPGQATEVAINKREWREKKRPFTFTNLPEDDYLELIIKTYPSHEGVTNQFLSLRRNDELMIHDVWGAIAYKGEGIFIAGGAGITPFLSIFRHLHKVNGIGGNKLIFANKTKADIICNKELEGMLGDAFVNILSAEQAAGCVYGLVTERFLEESIDGHTGKVYVCGPPPMMDSVLKGLENLGLYGDAVVVEL